VTFRTLALTDCHRPGSGIASGGGPKLCTETGPGALTGDELQHVGAPQQTGGLHSTDAQQQGRQQGRQQP
jgi:hypothetical protein